MPRFDSPKVPTPPPDRIDVVPGFNRMPQKRGWRLSCLRSNFVQCVADELTPLSLHVDTYTYTYRKGATMADARAAPTASAAAAAEEEPTVEVSKTHYPNGG